MEVVQQVNSKLKKSEEASQAAEDEQPKVEVFDLSTLSSNNAQPTASARARAQRPSTQPPSRPVMNSFGLSLSPPFHDTGISSTRAKFRDEATDVDSSKRINSTDAVEP